MGLLTQPVRSRREGSLEPDEKEEEKVFRKKGLP